MALDTKLNLSNSKFEQTSGDTLNLSGTTIIHGDIKYPAGKVITHTKQSLIEQGYYTGNTGVVFNTDSGVVKSIKSNIDIIGNGTITMTNGSTNIVGINTNFEDSTSGIGFSYWMSFHIVDSLNRLYRIDVGSVSSNTEATIQKAYSETDIRNGYNTGSSVYTGATGTYPYKLVMNYAKDLYAFSLGNKSYASNFGQSFGGSTTSIGSNAASFGSFTLASGAQSLTFGSNTIASGSRAVAGGIGTMLSGIDRRVRASGNNSFNFSENDISQTAGHGALGSGSIILGGLNHNIPSNSTRSIIIGGNTIKAASAVTDTVYLPKVRIGQGIGGSLSTDNTASNILVQNATTGEIQIRNASSIGSITGGTNGLTTSGKNIILGGTLTGHTSILGNSKQLYLGTSGSRLSYSELNTSGGYYVTSTAGGIGLQSTGTQIQITSIGSSLNMRTWKNPFDGGINQIFMSSYSSGTGGNCVIIERNLTGAGTTGTVEEVLRLSRTIPNGTGATNGIGAKINFAVKNSNTSTTNQPPAAGIAYIQTNVTPDFEESKYTFSILKGGLETNIVEFDRNGAKYLYDPTSGFTSLSLVHKGYVDSFGGGGGWNLTGTTILDNLDVESVRIKYDNDDALSPMLAFFNETDSIYGDKTLSIFSGDKTLQTNYSVISNTYLNSPDTGYIGLLVKHSVDDGDNEKEASLELQKNEVYLSYFNRTDDVDYKLTFIPTGAKFIDNSDIPKGIEYAADYSTTFTNRSLIDRGFGDNSYWKTSGTTTLNIPLTIQHDDVDPENPALMFQSGTGWSGAEEFTIIVGDRSLATDYALLSAWIEPGDSRAISLTGSDGNVQAYVQVDNEPRSTIGISLTGGIQHNLNFDNTGAILTDNRVSPKGIEYAADYSATYTDRSLIDYEHAYTNYWSTSYGTSLLNDVEIVRGDNNNHTKLRFFTGATDLGLNLNNNTKNSSVALSDAYSNTTLLATLQTQRIYPPAFSAYGNSDIILHNAYSGVTIRNVIELRAALFSASTYVTKLTIASKNEYNPSTHGNAGFYFEDGSYETGAKYAADYSANFTSRSIIDKGFSDKSYWKTSGTTTLRNADTVPIIVQYSTGSTKPMLFFGDNGFNAQAEINLVGGDRNFTGTSQVISITEDFTYIWGRLTSSTGPESSVEVRGTKVRLEHLFSDGVGGGITYFDISDSGAVFGDTGTAKQGIKYNGNYNATFTINSLTDVRYVTGKTTTVGFNFRTGSTYTLTYGDEGKTIDVNNASSNTIIVPPNSGVTFAVGTQILIAQYGVGQITISPGTGVTLRSYNNNLKLTGQYSLATLIKRGTNEWYVSGDLTS